MSAIRVSGGTLIVRDSEFIMGNDAPPADGFGADAFAIFVGHEVELTVTRCSFSSGTGNAGAGMAVSCAGGLIEDSTFVDQVASFEVVCRAVLLLSLSWWSY